MRQHQNYSTFFGKKEQFYVYIELQFTSKKYKTAIKETTKYVCNHHMFICYIFGCHNWCI